MAGQESFLQKLFCEISLDRDPALWQDDTDTKQRNAERVRTSLSAY